MSAFQSSLVTRILAPNELSGGRQLYCLTQPFVYESALIGRITVPADYLTDFASIPRIAWRYIDPEDPAILFASVIHDWLYTLAGMFATGQQYTRERADAVLREAMAVCGARWDQQAVVYRSVRLFGGGHWKETIP